MPETNLYFGGNRALAGVFLIATLVMACSVQAQSPPLPQIPPVDAGSLLQEVERQRPPPTPPRQGPALNVPPPLEPSAAPTAEFTVKNFTFAGNTKVTSSVLEAALVNYLNRPIQFKDLQEATNVVVDAYSKAGWLARAFIPRQDITEGTVRIHIIEALYGGSVIEGEFDHVSRERVQATVDSQLVEGDVLSLTAVERGLLLADDLPGVTVVGSLTAGENTQETDVLVSVEDTPWIIGRVQVDNQGNKSTGENEVSINASVDGLTGNADQLTAYGLYTQGLEFISAGYSIPVAYSGLRFGANYSTLYYRVVDQALISGGDRGTGYATTWGLEATQPIIRSRNTNLLARLGYTSKFFDNRFGSITTSKYTVGVYSLGITATHLDNLAGGGYTTLSLIPSTGEVDYSMSPDHQRIVQATTQSEGRFSKLRYGLSRQQNLPANFSIFVNFRGQIASKNLDSSEQFYLGGPSGVRAYPNNEAGGSQGNLLSLELRYNVTPQLQFAAFYDYGEVQKLKFKNAISFNNAPLNEGTLQGVGLSASWNGPYGVILNATWAIRVGDNPFANDAGLDTDGTLRRNRFWLNASVGF